MRCLCLALMYLTIVSRFTGVTDIETNVAAKSVVVTHADGVSPSEMLDKLTKVRYCVFFWLI
jgi:hypothetical protein